MAEIILVTGGARSGKSNFAEKLTLQLGNNHAAYIATAQIFDNEMAYRVKLHQARRKNNWANYEAPFDAEKIFPNVAENVILFDSVTMYLTNWILTKNLDDENIFVDFENFIEKLLAAAENSCAKVIFVSDEVGAGIVPENKLSRVFRDMLGLANQKIAAHSEKVFLTVAGLAVDIKKIAENNFAEKNILDEIKIVIKERKRIDVTTKGEWTDAIEKCWQKETEILSRDIEKTIDFIENKCSNDTFCWISEVFDDVAAITQSPKFIDAIKKRAAFITDKDQRRLVETDISFAEEKILPKNL